MLSEVIDHIPINERGFNLAINNLRKLKQKKFDDLQELFVLFTKFKTNNLRTIPSEQDMEKNAIKKVSLFANQHFFYEGDSLSRLTYGQSTVIDFEENKNWTHPVKGTEPEKILISLYTNLMYLVKEYCFIDMNNRVSAKSLNEVFQCILDKELNKVDGNKKVIMTCRLALKLLKSLKILPESDSKDSERSQMFSMQKKIIDTFLEIYKSCTSEYLKCF